MSANTGLLAIAALALIGLGMKRAPSVVRPAPGGGVLPMVPPSGQPIVTPSGAPSPDVTPAPVATALPYQQVADNVAARFDYLFRVMAATTPATVDQVLLDAGQAYANKTMSFDDYDSITRAVNSRLQELQIAPVAPVVSMPPAVEPLVTTIPTGLTPQQARFYPYLGIVPQATANWLASTVGEAFGSEAEAAEAYTSGRFNASESH